MSAPHTNLDTQKRWHRAPIIGMVSVVIFALGLLFWQMVIVADSAPTGGDSGRATEVPSADQHDAVPEPGPVTPPADNPVVPAQDPANIPDGDLPPAELPVPQPDLPDQPLPDEPLPDQPLPDGGATTP